MVEKPTAGEERLLPRYNQLIVGAEDCVKRYRFIDDIPNTVVRNLILHILPVEVSKVYCGPLLEVIDPLLVIDM